MSATEFTNVSVSLEANITYDGRCSSHTLLFSDGSKKMLGVIVANDDDITSYHFKTNTSERIEITNGECQVKVKGEKKYTNYRTGQSFVISGDSSFKIRANQVVQYICHLEG